MSVEIEAPFLSIDEVAKNLKVSVNSIIHLGMSQNIKIAAYIKITNEKWFPISLLGIDSFHYKSGIYYLSTEILENLLFEDTLDNVNFDQIIPIGVSSEDKEIFYKYYSVMIQNNTFDKCSCNDSTERYSDMTDNWPTETNTFIENLDDYLCSDVVGGGLSTETIPKDLLTIYSKNLVVLKEDLMDFNLTVLPTLKDLKVLGRSTAGNSDPINRRREETLLLTIANLLEIIFGDSKCKEIVKHPSIKDQTELIEKLAEIKTPGLSKRNLEKIFPVAKRLILAQRELPEKYEEA